MRLEWPRSILSIISVPLPVPFPFFIPLPFSVPFPIPISITCPISGRPISRIHLPRPLPFSCPFSLSFSLPISLPCIPFPILPIRLSSRTEAPASRSPTSVRWRVNGFLHWRSRRRGMGRATQRDRIRTGCDIRRWIRSVRGVWGWMMLLLLMTVILIVIVVRGKMRAPMVATGITVVRRRSSLVSPSCPRSDTRRIGTGSRIVPRLGEK